MTLADTLTLTRTHMQPHVCVICLLYILVFIARLGRLGLRLRLIKRFNLHNNAVKVLRIDMVQLLWGLLGVKVFIMQIAHTHTHVHVQIGSKNQNAPRQANNALRNLSVFGYFCRYLTPESPSDYQRQTHVYVTVYSALCVCVWVCVCSLHFASAHASGAHHSRNYWTSFALNHRKRFYNIFGIM